LAIKRYVVDKEKYSRLYQINKLDGAPSPAIPPQPKRTITEQYLLAERALAADETYILSCSSAL
jgi:hypothetical protein